MSNLQINLPTDFHNLKSLLVDCIQDFSGSPVTNKSNNKLNEILALRLGFKNYDSLSAALPKKKDVIENLYDISFYNNNLFINDVEIDDSIFDGDIAEYSVSDREDFIDNLYLWIAEAKQTGRYTGDMEEDLLYLLKCNDEYILKSVSSSGVIAFSKEPETFNSYCQEILNYQSDI